MHWSAGRHVPQWWGIVSHLVAFPAVHGLIPWALSLLSARHGWASGLPGPWNPLCLALGIKELTFYGFTQDNTKRPADQKGAFQNACIKAVKWLVQRDTALLVIGDSHSPLFPVELLPFTRRTVFGKGLIRVNLLVNYGWRWDISYASRNGSELRRSEVERSLASADVSRIDLIIRWGGRRRLSGFLPVQSVYADFFFLDALWPEFEPEHLFHALRWYEQQDVTLGG